MRRQPWSSLTVVENVDWVFTPFLTVRLPPRNPRNISICACNSFFTRNALNWIT
jgi:hypothetical protein